MTTPTKNTCIGSHDCVTVFRHHYTFACGVCMCRINEMCLLVCK